MTVAGRVTFLGTGTSGGVPMIGCECANCRSTNPKDKRLRPSILVDVPGRVSILVDTSTDLRQQALRHGISTVDAILFTHSHADHVMGLDEVRRFNMMRNGESIPCYASPLTWGSIKRTFYYVFDGEAREGGGIPRLTAHDIDGPFVLGGVHIVPVPIWHGTMPILGFRFGSFAYLTDCSGIPDESLPLVEGVDTLVIDALRDKRHSTHFSIDEALAAVRRIAPARAFFTHMNHDLGHEETNARLPPGVALAYDGQVLDVAVDGD